MRHRTCIIVTHAVDLCLPGSAYVVSMDNGSIISSGSPELVATSVSADKDDLAAASAITIEAIAAGETDEEVTVEQAEAKRARQEKLKLVKDETMSEGESAHFRCHAAELTFWLELRVGVQGCVPALFACDGRLVACRSLPRHLRWSAGCRDW